jgi:hypothetical protein
MLRLDRGDGRSSSSPRAEHFKDGGRCRASKLKSRR